MLLNRKSNYDTSVSSGLWMFDGNIRRDYHLLQFLKRFELSSEEYNRNNLYCSTNEKDKSRELAFIR